MQHIDGVDYRHNIFIFLSNTGGREITGIARDTWNSGKKREVSGSNDSSSLRLRYKNIKSQDITLTDLEPLVADGAFNEVGGLQYSRMIEKSLVDVFVPFLPLERRHVKICIRNEFERRNVLDWTERMVDEVADQLVYW